MKGNEKTTASVKFPTMHGKASDPRNCKFDPRLAVPSCVPGQQLAKKAQRFARKVKLPYRASGRPALGKTQLDIPHSGTLQQPRLWNHRGGALSIYYLKLTTLHNSPKTRSELAAIKLNAWLPNHATALRIKTLVAPTPFQFQIRGVSETATY